MILHHTWKFRVLLVALLALMMIYPLIADDSLARLCYSTAWSIVQIVTIYAISDIRWQRRVGLCLGLPLLVGVWGRHFVSDQLGEMYEVGLYGVSVVFFAVVAAMVMRHLVTREVTADNVAGAVCAYLLLGMGAGLFYTVIETLYPHSFQASGELAKELTDPALRRSALTYFSFVTLTTAGYGDLTPATPLTRTLVSLEAVLGQFYLAILVAGLVGIRVSRRANGNSAGR